MWLSHAETQCNSTLKESSDSLWKSTASPSQLSNHYIVKGENQTVTEK